MNISRSKWWEIAFAVVGIICLILGTKWIRSGELPQQRIVIDAGGCPPPSTTLKPRITNEPPGTVILLHGLAANRQIMMYLASEFAGHGLQVYALDFPGHGDSTDSFSFAKSADCAAAAVESLSKSGRIDTTKTVLVGHSMGGAIAIGMSDRIPVAATIAISPAPMTLPKRMPSNLLVFSGEYELWIMQPLFPEIPPETLALNLDLAPYATANRGRHRLAGAVLGLIGILFLFPFCATLITSLSERRHAESDGTRPPYALSLAEVAVAALAGV